MALNQTEKSGWYPGKYLIAAASSGGKTASGEKDVGVVVLEPDSEHDDLDRSSLQEEDLMPIESSDKKKEDRRKSWFGFSGSSSTSSRSLEDTEENESESLGADSNKNELCIARTVRGIRQKVLNRKISGSIRIHRVSGLVSTAVVCKVTPTEEPGQLAETEETDISAMSLTDNLLNSLENRSLAWENCDFNADVTLTRGGTIGLSDPIFGVIGFSLTIEITATVQSLISSKKLRMAQKEFEKSTISSRGSAWRSST
jgi:hypothetical protein